MMMGSQKTGTTISTVNHLLSSFSSNDLKWSSPFSPMIHVCLTKYFVGSFVPFSLKLNQKCQSLNVRSVRKCVWIIATTRTIFFVTHSSDLSSHHRFCTQIVVSCPVSHYLCVYRYEYDYLLLPITVKRCTYCYS
jgi:hypothetical protein